MRIITDTGSLLSQEEAQHLGVRLLPLQVEIGGKNYRDYFDIGTSEFIELTKNFIPNSSQPAIGEVMSAYEEPEEALHITMSKGLSSTFDSASGIQNQLGASHITLFNTMTLAGNQKYLVELACRLRDQHHPMKEIVKRLNHCLSSCQSFLIPVDFDYLKRGGRLSNTAALLSGFLHLKPIITQTEGSQRLEKFGVARTWGKAIDDIMAHMKKQGVGLSHKITISHAVKDDIALMFAQKIKQVFSMPDIEILLLTPVMITQGGPGCVAIQYILRDDN